MKVVLTAFVEVFLIEAIMYTHSAFAEERRQKTSQD